MKKYGIIIGLIIIGFFAGGITEYFIEQDNQTFQTTTFVDGSQLNSETHIIVLAIKEDEEDLRPNEFVYYNRVEGKTHDDVFGKCVKNSDNSVTMYHDDESVFAYVIKCDDEYKMLKDGEEIPLQKVDDTVILMNPEFTEWPYAHK